MAKRYSKEQIKWVIENCKNYNDVKSLHNSFCEEFGNIKELKQFKSWFSRNGYTLDARRRYTEEQLNFLKENQNHFTLKKLTEMFNEKFNEKRTCSALQSQYLRLGVKKDRTRTEEQKKWLIENYDKYDTYEDILNAFNDVFGNIYSNVNSLQSYCCKQLKIKKINNHLWGVNIPPYNEKEKYNVGDIVKRADGYFIKLNKYNFYEYGRYLYEKKYGKVPSEDFIIHLDGNKFNNDLENLYHLPKKLTPIMAKLGFYNKGKLTIAGAKYCEIINLLKGLE